MLDDPTSVNDAAEGGGGGGTCANSEEHAALPFHDSFLPSQIFVISRGELRSTFKRKRTQPNAIVERVEAAFAANSTGHDVVMSSLGCLQA